MAAWCWRTAKKHLGFNCLFVLICLFCSIYMTTSSPFGFLTGSGQSALYGPEDKVVFLNVSNIKETIFNSDRAWFVEFYSSWCGHCIHFAPKWKQFALDVWDWRGIVAVAGIDCADENNTPVCREFDIMGYPTLLLFPPQAPPLVEASEKQKEKNILETVNRGIAVQKTDTMEKLKRNLIDSLTEFHPKLLAFSNLSGASVSELWQSSEFYHKTKPAFILLIYESESSFIGREVILRLSNYNSIKVYRFPKKNPLYAQLELEGWPAVGFLNEDGTSGPVVIGSNSNMIDFLVKATLGLSKATESQLSGKLAIPGIRQDDVEDKKKPSPFPVSNGRDVVSMDDLLHAVRDSLHKEIALVKIIDGAKIIALKKYISVLKNLFPSDRREVTVFLEKLYEWFSSKTEIENSEYMEKLNNLETELRPWDIDLSKWDECRGTVPGRRGYTCGLWRLFHTLTIIGVQKNTNEKVLEAIHDYVSEFFGCQECVGHFKAMVSRDKILSVEPIMTQALWLWKAHNEVNLRLKGAESEDPGFPKQKYPTQLQCSECYDGSANMDEGKVLEYLLRIYSQPHRSALGTASQDAGNANIVDSELSENNARGGKVLHVDSKGALVSSLPVNLMSADLNKSQQQSWLGLFSIGDIGIFLIVYLSVACLLLLGYVHFKTVARRRISPSFLFRKMCSTRSIV